MKKIKVLEMIDQPFLGGGQMALLFLARNLDREKFEVSVCARDGGPFAEEVKKNNIDFYPVSFSKKFQLSIIKEIRAILEKNQTDILHTHGGIAGFYGRWAARRSRLPIIIHTLHGIHYLHYRNTFLKWIYVFLERYFSRLTDAVIFVSDADRDKAEEFKLAARVKMQVIKNGLDFSFPGEAGSLEEKRDGFNLRLKLEAMHPLVGTVARLHRQKGIVYLLKAAEIIHRAVPEVKVIVIGGGPLEKKLRNKARRMRLERYFLFLGERKDTKSLLSFFDVFVLPSLWEGLPLVLLEAAAAGKPIVASDIDGVREVIKDGETGILVPPKNPEKMAEAIIRLLQDRSWASKLGEKAKAVIPASFTLSRMIEETQNLYLKSFQEKI